MIERYYKVFCDYCGDLLAEFDHKPTQNELLQECLDCTSTKVFCSSQCHGDWNHDRQERMNLRQNGAATLLMNKHNIKIHDNGELDSEQAS